MLRPLKTLRPSDRKTLMEAPFGPGKGEIGGLWREIVALGPDAMADLGRADRFYLFTVMLHRLDGWHPWIYDRCREVEQEPDGRLDLWSREHYKSSLITYAGSIQELLRDPEITIGIFSHTKPNARKFLLQIKAELEGNETLKNCYPDVLWRNPAKEAITWSEEKGLSVKRRSNPREATIEAHGLVDGQPTGSHFQLRVYDDIVTLEAVSTAEQVAKVTAAHALSDNLGARGPDGQKRAWHIGTRYKFGDTYQDLIDRKALIPRIYPATDDGTPTGKPVFLTQKQLDDARRNQPTAIFAAQMLQNPTAGATTLFRPEWLRFTDIRPATLNVYIMCDPASSRKRGSDSTAIKVVGLDAGRNKYLLGGYKHKMGLTERWQKLKHLHQTWSAAPGVQFVKVGYERFGLHDALEHFEERMEIERIGFEIIELSWPTQGANSKPDRIQRLEPDFRAGKWFFAEMPIDKDGKPIEETRNQRMVREAGQAYRVMRPPRAVDHEGNVYSLNKVLLDEYLAYPYVTHDDGLDCLSRFYDMDPAPPILLDSVMLEPEIFVDGV